MYRALGLVGVLVVVVAARVGAEDPPAGKPQPAESARAQVSEKQLEQWLKQFPEADANKDGKLTWEEAVAYRQQTQKRQAGQPKKQTPPTLADVKYGPYARNVLDVWQVKSDKPSPVVIYFHGGGFVAGDKSSLNPETNLQQGFAVVSANYRFVKGGSEAAPYPAPMLDGARAVQFVRSKAKEWNIDPARVCLSGTSAGAVMSLWIAYHDDLARAESDDPVARQSTRAACVVPIAAPTNLDPAYIHEKIGGNRIAHPSLFPFFGVGKLEELATPEKQKLVREASPMNLVTKDDAPTFSLYFSELTPTPLPEKTDVSVSIHHAQFGVLLKEKLDAAGVPNDLAYVGDGRNFVEQATKLQEFMKKYLVE